MKKFTLKTIDKAVIQYLGMDEQNVISPILIKNSRGKMTVYSTISYKRHLIKDAWEGFYNSIEKKEKTECKLRTIGIMMGKIVAKELIISFEKINIQLI